MQNEKTEDIATRDADEIIGELPPIFPQKEIPWPVVWAAGIAFFFGIVRMQEAIVKSLLENELTEEQVVEVMMPVAAQAKKAALWTCGALGIVGVVFMRSSIEALRVGAAFMVALAVWLAVKHLATAKNKDELGAKGALQLLWKRAKGE